MARDPVSFFPILFIPTAGRKGKEKGKGEIQKEGRGRRRGTTPV